MKEQKKLKGFSHFILTRYNNGIYDREDAEQWMQSRYELFKRTSASVAVQKADFTWVIAFDERTPKAEIKKICNKSYILPFIGDIRNIDLKEYTSEKWVITSRFDNDDEYLPDAIATIQQRFTQELQVIDIDYYQYYNGHLYTSERRGPNSPFLSLVEPIETAKTCYCRPHSVLLDGYPSPDGHISIKASKIREPLALMVLHSENMANKLVGKLIR